jgi:hypothetical protein
LYSNYFNYNIFSDITKCVEGNDSHGRDFFRKTFVSPVTVSFENERSKDGIPALRLVSFLFLQVDLELDWVDLGATMAAKETVMSNKPERKESSKPPQARTMRASPYQTTFHSYANESMIHFLIDPLQLKI